MGIKKRITRITNFFINREIEKLNKKIQICNQEMFSLSGDYDIEEHNELSMKLINLKKKLR